MEHWRLATMGSGLEKAPEGLTEAQKARWEELMKQQTQPMRENDGSWIIVSDSGRIGTAAFRGKAKRGQAHNATDPEGYANALKMAAAPDMLRVCQRVAKGECTCADGGEGFQCEVCEAKAAIAKATHIHGQSSI